MRRLIAAVSSGLVLLVATGSIAASTTTVPNVVGLSVQEASERLAAAKIGVEALDSETTANQALKNTVKSQSIPAGQQVPLSAKIRLTVYRTYAPGVVTVTAPNLVGMTKDEARRTAEAAGLNFDNDRFLRDVPTSETKLIGRIASQSPAAGKVVPRGDLVHWSLYCPQPLVEVPDEVGHGEAAAIAGLKSKGFIGKSQEMPTSDSKLFGKVIRQDPPAGTKAAKESTVTLFVAVGAKKLVVPNVVGMNLEEGSRAIREAGLEQANFPQTVLTTDRKAVGHIAEQTPAAGARVSEGTKVQVKYYKADVVQVPSVLTYTRQSALRVMQLAGFVVEFREEKAPSAAFIDKVVRQNPGHGGLVMRGSSVTVYIGTK